jgi:chromosome segregation ATPase
MPTMAPPDGELKQRFARIDERFDEVNRRITEGREETGHRFDRVEGDVRDLKKSVASIQTTLSRIGIGVGLTLVSVLLTKGV